MDLETALFALGALLASTSLTAAIRKLAWSQGMLDVPNDRSSHLAPTPRGGGIAIVVASTAGCAVLAIAGAVPLKLFLALTGGGVAVATIGLLDDRFGMSAGLRLAVHVAAALWALVLLGGLPPIRIAEHVVTFGWAGHVLAVAGIVWVLNLFNFMDGIDGIATAEAAFVALGAAMIASVNDTWTGTSSVALVLAAASCGFLLWNWPPARIFMGDVGSGYLGYVIAVLAVASAHEDPVGLLVWLILGAAFFIDALVTLVRRLARGERVYEAHRTHAYQWLSRRWGSHQRVTLTFLAINLGWLLPLAICASLRPDLSTWIAAAALLPLVVLALLAGAGRKESATTSVENQSKDQ